MTNDLASAKMITVEDVAELVGCCPHTIRSLVKRGGIPKPCKVGGMVRWPRQTIMLWIAGGCPPVAVEGLVETKTETLKGG